MEHGKKQVDSQRVSGVQKQKTMQFFTNTLPSPGKPVQVTDRLKFAPMQGAPGNERASLLLQNEKQVLDLAKTSRNPLANTSQNGNYSSAGILNQLPERSVTVQG